MTHHSHAGHAGLNKRFGIVCEDGFGSRGRDTSRGSKKIKIHNKLKTEDGQANN